MSSAGKGTSMSHEQYANIGESSNGSVLCSYTKMGAEISEVSHTQAPFAQASSLQISWLHECLKS